MSNVVIEKVERSFLKKNAPLFRVGDQVRVDVKIVEGESERVQAFEGVVISRKGRGISETFTVRKVSFGVGVERTFPVHSPRVEGVKVVRAGRVRRAKLYYLRALTGKAARIQEDVKDAAVKTEGAAAAPPANGTAQRPAAPPANGTAQRPAAPPAK